MKKGYLYIAMSTILFSTMEIALKTIGGQFHPIQLTLSRFLIGGIFLLPVALSALKKRGITLSASDIRAFAGLGFVGVVCSMICYQLSLLHVQASVVAVLFSSNPVFVTFFAFVFIHEAIYRRNIAALILEILGIIIIINPLHIQLDMTGILFVLLSTIAFALYGVLGKKKCSTLGGVVVTCGSFLLGSAEMLLLTALSHIPAVSGALASGSLSLFSSIPLLSGYTASNIGTFLYIAIGVTGMGYVCYFMAMEVTSASTASLTFFFKPALAPILAMIILKESIPFNMLAGILCILAGSIVSLYPSLTKGASLNETKGVSTHEIK